MRQLTTDVLEALHSFQDEKRKIFGNKTYPSKLEIIGVTVPNIRKILVEIKSETKDWEVSEKFDCVLELLNTGYFEAHQLALEWVAKDKPLMNYLNPKRLDQLCVHMDNWVAVDTFAVLILGPSFKKGTVDISKLHQLIHENDFWMRRMAIASTVALNKRTTTKTGASAVTLSLSEKVVSDNNEMVVKALSWALRSLISWDRAGVIEFIETHQTVLNKRVLREVKNKLTTGLKS